MEQQFSEFEISAIIDAISRKSKFVGTGSLTGTYKHLYEHNIVKPSLGTTNNNKFYNFFLTDYGYEFASHLNQLFNL